MTMSNIEIITPELPALFTTTPKQQVLHQAVVAYLANARQSNAHTKTRGEVAGGGRKPWKQKGTGRARAGSSRSPIWVGGGITFGPRSDANYGKRLPVKLKRLALAMALTTKATEGKVTVVSNLAINEPKTKEVVAIIKQIAPEAQSVLLISHELEPQLLVAARNLPNAAVVTVTDLNAYDILNFDHLVFTQEAITVAQTVFGKEQS